MAPIAYFFIPDVPDKARFLNSEEKAVAKARGVSQAGKGPRIGAINFKDLGLTLIDLKAWLTAVSFESIQIGLRTLLLDPSADDLETDVDSSRSCISVPTSATPVFLCFYPLY